MIKRYEDETRELREIAAEIDQTTQSTLTDKLKEFDNLKTELQTSHNSEMVSLQEKLAVTAGQLADAQKQLDLLKLQESTSYIAQN